MSKSNDGGPAFEDVNMPAEIERAITRLRVAEYTYAIHGYKHGFDDNSLPERFRLMQLSDRMAAELRRAIYAALAAIEASEPKQ